MIVGRLVGGRRWVAGCVDGVSRRAVDHCRAVETRQVLKRDDHRAHHVVVFVIEDVAVPYVTRTCRRVKRECVLPGRQVRVVRVLQCQTDQHSRNHEWRGKYDVLPSVLAGKLAGGYRCTRHAWLGKVVCSTQGAVLRVKLEVTGAKHTGRGAWIRRRTLRGVWMGRVAELHRKLHIDPYRG